MKFKSIIATAFGLALALSPSFAGATSPLTTSCVGTPAATTVTWTASFAGGVSPVSYLWGNGATSSTQTLSAIPGTYAITLQTTDASSTVATSTCSAVIAPLAPTITSFTAVPSTITNGQSSVLSWTVANASSTSINNGVGTVTGTSVTVSPNVTTTYQLSATNPATTVTANVTVTVNAPTTNNTSSQIQDLMHQIELLRAQILELLKGQNNGNSGGEGTTTPPVVTTGHCGVFARNLSRGDDGDDVRELQQTLAQDPSIFPEGNVTGFFGHKTEDAVKRFQLKHGVAATSTITGFFGPRSRKFFQERCHEIKKRDKHEDRGRDHSNDNQGENHDKGNGRDD